MINAHLFSFTQKENLVNNEVSLFLQDRTSNFKPETEPQNIENSYYREYIEGDDLSKIKSFLDDVKQTISFEFAYPHASLTGVWINRVDNTSNKNDVFHRDINKFSSVTFLNDDFEGGAFEYVDIRYQKIEQVKPSLYNTIVFEGCNIPHRVQPVSSGTRYTLVTFWGLDSKTTKTIL